MHDISLIFVDPENRYNLQSISGGKFISIEDTAFLKAIISMKRELSKFNCIIDVKSEDSVYFKPGKLITKEKIITIETLKQ